jgi:2-dehydro-3-deoxygluconokinase
LDWRARNPLGRLAEILCEMRRQHRRIVWAKLAAWVHIMLSSRTAAGQVTCDRANICVLQPEDIGWEALLNTRLLHLTGITPALSPSCREIVSEAIRKARQRGVPISFDVNFRQKLWSETEARDTLTPLMQGVELLFCSQADATRLFDCKGSIQDIAQSMLEHSQARYVVITFAEQGALLWNGKEWLHEPSRATISSSVGRGNALLQV